MGCCLAKSTHGFTLQLCGFGRQSPAWAETASTALCPTPVCLQMALPPVMASGACSCRAGLMEAPPQPPTGPQTGHTMLDVLRVGSGLLSSGGPWESVKFLPPPFRQGQNHFLSKYHNSLIALKEVTSKHVSLLLSWQREDPPAPRHSQQGKGKTKAGIKGTDNITDAETESLLWVKPRTRGWDSCRRRCGSCNRPEEW